VTVRIRGNAQRALLTLLPKDGEPEHFQLRLGSLDPITEISGIQARLRNIGIDCGPVDGRLGPKTREALISFQKANQLQPTGEPDEATRARLKEAHGC
jgi:peptidoglycan hydrolase-like protein with peptidoglycan-binding domain